MLTILLGVFEEGLVYAIMALGVYITYRILDFPDLSVDSTFPLGAAVSIILITKNMSPLLTLFIAFAAGACAGVVTGLIHVKGRVKNLLSGIIVMTALYSLNLRIAGGRANVAIFSKETLFKNSFIHSIIPLSLQPYTALIVLTLMVVIVKLIMDWYLKTKSGYLLRAVGDNATLVTSLAIDKGIVKIVGLALANALVALSGAIFAQKNGFFEISTGTGTIVIGLASVIIGTKLLKPLPIFKPTTAVIVGSIFYKACVALAISLGFSAMDMKLITASLFFIILIISNYKKRRTAPNA